jgi:hypothetical protein
VRISLAVTLLLIAAAASWFGTPHVLDEQRCASYDGGRHCAYVISCTYVGIQGYRKVFPEWKPEVRLCPGVAWFPLEWPLGNWRDAPPLLKGEQ